MLPIRLADKGSALSGAVPLSPCPQCDQLPASGQSRSLAVLNKSVFSANSGKLFAVLFHKYGVATYQLKVFTCYDQYHSPHVLCESVVNKKKPPLGVFCRSNIPRENPSLLHGELIKKTTTRCGVGNRGGET